MRLPEKNMQMYNRGFTLIELTIGLFLGLIVVSSILAIYVPSLSTYKKTNAMSVIQESERYAVDVLNRSMQQAGYYGCNSSSDVPYINSVDFTDASVPASLKQWAYSNQPVRGFSSTASSAILDTAFDSGFQSNLLTHGSAKIGDILMISTGQDTNLVIDSHNLVSETIDFKGDVTSLLQKGMILQLNNCENQAIAFQIDTVDDPVYDSGNDITTVDYSAAKTNNCTATKEDLPANPGNYIDLGKVYLGGGTGASCEDDQHRALFSKVNYREFLTGTHVEATAFYLRADANGLPTLFRTSTNTGGVAEQLLEGVENMRVMYGLDTTANGAVDQYQNAATLNATPANWSNVRTIRISLLIRSLAGAGESDAVQNFSFPDVAGAAVNCSSTSPDSQACPGFIFSDPNSINDFKNAQSFGRRVVEKTFSVRNSFL